MNLPDRPKFLQRPDGSTIAYHRLTGKSPGIIFCGGLHSDMEGTKALALEEYCRAAGRAFLRFDYFGHGASSGHFLQGTIGRWREDTLAVLDALTCGPQILVGSSLGGWLTLLAALARPERITALVGIAPAPDFTERLMWECYLEDIRQTLLRDGFYLEPSVYSDAPYPISLNLIQEGRRHLLLDRPIPLRCPIRILQGMQDADVPWTHALALAQVLPPEQTVLTLIGDGDHRLSRPQDLARLSGTLAELLTLPEVAS